MLFWPSDRKTLNQLAADVAEIKSKLGRMTPAEEDMVADSINKVSGQLDSLQRDPKKVVSNPYFRKE